jgi:acyl carrier protein
MSEDIKAKVKQIICEQLSVSEEDVVSEASFVDDLGADSLDLVEMIMAMEEAFNISIADEEAEQIKSVQDAWDFIETRS